MRFVSTRSPKLAPVGLSQALAEGLAPDGGLYVPEQLPTVEAPDAPGSLIEEAQRFLAPFFSEDPLAAELSAVCAETFDIPLPWIPLRQEDDGVLELFHGPTAAFKDFGARFLAACMARLPASPGEDAEAPRTILVATSGDTGGAVAAAFHGRPDSRVWVLFPEGRVSPRQEAQLTGWGGNVTAFAVQGTFDDCQRIAKEAFRRPDLRQRYRLTSANSINVGRLLPQAAYHWAAAVQHRAATGRPYRPIVPTGNLGHGLAAVWARAVGAPTEEIALALNVNRAVLDYIETGEARPRPAIPTLANAMDVGIPSNLERLRHLLPGLDPVRDRVFASSFDDDAIREEIRGASDRWGIVPCPHTACALLARRGLEGRGWTAVATAHPAKFDQIVEPLVGHTVELPPALAELMARPRHKRAIPPTLEALEAEMPSAA